MMQYTAAYIKTLRAPTVRRLLRERGLTMADVARAHGCKHSVVSRAVAKRIASQPVWETLVVLLNDDVAAEAARRRRAYSRVFA